MSNKNNRKKLQKDFAKKSIQKYLNFLENKFYPKLNKFYIKQIKNLTQSFNIRLKREEKLLFCKKCSIAWNSDTRQIRLNPSNSCKEYICLNCSYVKRFKYK